MQMRGTPRDLLPGDPVCSPMATVLAEATTQLIRILHRTDHWTHRINKTMIERLHKIKPCFRESASASGSGGGQRLKKSRSVQSREEHDAQRESQETPTRTEEERGRHGRQHGLGELSEHHLRTLCTEVWPVLAIIGGADAGLRVGGRCVHKQTGRHATLLGVVKEGSTSAKVQWDEAEITIRYRVLLWHLFGHFSLTLFFVYMLLYLLFTGILYTKLSASDTFILILTIPAMLRFWLSLLLGKKLFGL